MAELLRTLSAIEPTSFSDPKDHVGRTAMGICAAQGVSFLIGWPHLLHQVN